MRGFLLHTFDKRSTQHLKNIGEVTHIHSASTWPRQDSISDSLSTTVHTAPVLTEALPPLPSTEK